MVTRALVTGGAKRLGRAIVLALAGRGLDVVIHYRRSANAAESLCDEVRALGVRAWAIRADLANPDEVDGLFSEAEARTGGVDLLVNSASIFPESTLLTFSESDLTENVRVNAMAPLWLSRSLAGTGRPGCIVNLLDSTITGSDDTHAAYHLSKRMLLTLTRMMAREFAPQLRVNGVAPGLVLPPEGKDLRYLEARASGIPLKRYGSAEDVASAVVFLAASEFVTGQIIFVDGGRHLEGNRYV